MFTNSFGSGFWLMGVWSNFNVWASVLHTFFFYLWQPTADKISHTANSLFYFWHYYSTRGTWPSHSPPLPISVPSVPRALYHHSIHIYHVVIRFSKLPFKCITGSGIHRLYLFVITLSVARGVSQIAYFYTKYLLFWVPKYTRCIHAEKCLKIQCS